MEYLTGFRDLVKALHEAKIEIILDVVFNHTSESDETGPTICMRGIDNSVYYMLDASDRSRYLNYTGTWQYRELQSSRSSPNDSRMPALLGRRHACGRLSL